MVEIHALCPRIATGGDEGKNRGGRGPKKGGGGPKVRAGGFRPPERPFPETNRRVPKIYIYIYRHHS